MRAFGRRIKQAATDWFALPPDALLDASRVTCLNGEELTMENVVSLERVSDTAVEVELQAHVVVVEGRDFVVTLVTDQEIHMRGSIDQITYRRRPGATP